MALTKVTVELDNIGLNEVLSALELRRQTCAELGAKIQAQANAQVMADKRRTERADARERARLKAYHDSIPGNAPAAKPNGHAPGERGPA